MCYRFISCVEVNDECALVFYAQPPSTMFPPLCEGENLCLLRPDWMAAQNEGGIFGGGNTCAVYRKVLLAVHRFLC